MHRVYSPSDGALQVWSGLTDDEIECPDNGLSSARRCALILLTSSLL